MASSLAHLAVRPDECALERSRDFDSLQRRRSRRWTSAVVRIDDLSRLNEPACYDHRRIRHYSFAHFDDNNFDSTDVDRRQFVDRGVVEWN
jgi:hypothetical protein